MAKRIPRSMDIPVTQKMFFDFKDELKEFITSQFLEFRADMKDMRADIADMRTDLVSMQSEMSRFSGRQDRTDASIASLKSDFHQVKIMMEAQGRQNQVALDGVRHALEEVVAVRERVDKLEIG